MAYYPQRLTCCNVLPVFYCAWPIPIHFEHSFNLPEYRHSVDISAMTFPLVSLA